MFARNHVHIYLYSPKPFFTNPPPTGALARNAQTKHNSTKMAANAGSSKHIVLVHGLGHGAWCWYKAATQLRAAGHRVTAPDLAASGIDPRQLSDVRTFAEYTQPLFDVLRSLPAGEKVVLVGHSLGGVSIALAAEMFPEKIAVAVFLTAFMPESTSAPAGVLLKFAAGQWVDWMDTESKAQDAEGKLPSTVLFGPQFMQEKLYQLCSPEELTLAKSLVRVGSMFLQDPQLQQPLSSSRYGSVDAVFIVCKQDLTIVEQFQRLMIDSRPVKEVKEIDGADHMAMVSAPDQVVKCLADIVGKL